MTRTQLSTAGTRSGGTTRDGSPATGRGSGPRCQPGGPSERHDRRDGAGDADELDVREVADVGAHVPVPGRRQRAGVGGDAIDGVWAAAGARIGGQPAVEGRRRRPRVQTPLGHRPSRGRGSSAAGSRPPRAGPAEVVPRLAVGGDEIGAHIQVRDGGHDRSIVCSVDTNPSDAPVSVRAFSSRFPSGDRAKAEDQRPIWERTSTTLAGWLRSRTTGANINPVTIHRSVLSQRVRTRSSIRRRRSVAALVAVALMASACSDDDDVSTTEAPATSEVEDPVAAAEARVEEAESGVTDSQEALEAAGEQFCVDAESYIEVLDRYGKLFTDDAATVGDIQTLGADLVEPRETVASVGERGRGGEDRPRRSRAGARRRAGSTGGGDRHRVERADQLDDSRDHDDDHARSTGHDRARPAGRGRSRPNRRGDHGGDPTGGGDRGVQLGGVRAPDRMAQAVLRCGLPHRRAAGRGSRAGDGVHDDTADRAATGRLLRRSHRRDLRPAHRRCREETAGRQRPPRDRVRRQGHRRGARRAVGRARPANGGRRPDPHRRGPDRAHVDRLLARPHRRRLDRRADRRPPGVPDRARRRTHRRRRRGDAGRLPASTRRAASLADADHHQRAGRRPSRRRLPPQPHR